MNVTILFPVLNERLRLQKGIETCVEYVKNNLSDPVRIVIVDNGSDDETPEIGRRLEEEYEMVTYRRIEERGVGIAFRTGVTECNTDIVGYMDVDLSTDLKYLARTLDLFREDPDLQYVNGSRFSRDSVTQGRKWYRKITSAGLVFLLKNYLGMKATDALCGFTFLRTEVAKKLVAECSDDKGWFFTVELLLRAERQGIRILDLPIEWVEDYNTTVNVSRTIRNYLKRMAALKKAFKEEERNAQTN